MNKALKNSVMIFILVSLIILSIPVYAAVPGSKGNGEPAVTSKGAMVFDSVRGQVLYNNNSDQKLTIPMAADIMTLLIAVDKIKLDTKVTIPEQIKSTLSNEIIFDSGVKYGMDELYLSLILSPTPAVSDIIVQHSIGDEENFVAQMNQKAKVLGMKDVNFTAASSYNSEDLVLTLNDFAKLVMAAVNNPIIDSCLSTSAKPWSSKDGTHVLINPNKLFWMGLEGINGGAYQVIKQSGTSITTASREGQKLICLVSGGKGDEIFNDTTSVMNYAFSKFNKSLLVAKDTELTQTEYSGMTLPLVSMEDVYYTHPVGNSYIKSLDFKIKSDIKPPINENTVLGTARYVLSDDTVIEVNLCSKTEVKAANNILNTLKLRLNDNKDVFYIIIVLCIIEVFLIGFKIVKKKYKNKVHE
jgi:D-alanyl-D-alanine carboxypeptidase